MRVSGVGRTFFCENQVKTIEMVAAIIARLIPNLKVGENEMVELLIAFGFRFLQR